MAYLIGVSYQHLDPPQHEDALPELHFALKSTQESGEEAKSSIDNLLLSISYFHKKDKNNKECCYHLIESLRYIKTDNLSDYNKAKLVQLLQDICLQKLQNLGAATGKLVIAGKSAKESAQCYYDQAMAFWKSKTGELGKGTEKKNKEKISIDTIRAQLLFWLGTASLLP